jgi:hypothetical protein
MLLTPELELRDKFALTAPKEIPDWFYPKMPSYDEFRHKPGCSGEQDIVIRNKFRAEEVRQKMLQWPYAYADLQMTARGEPFVKVSDRF